MAGGSLIAMDAEQQRAANGQFGSGGGGSFKNEEEASNHFMDTRAKFGKGSPEELKAKKAYRGFMATAKDADIDTTSSMSGEAGRQARKLARDCNTGRFRP